MIVVRFYRKGWRDGGVERRGEPTYRWTLHVHQSDGEMFVYCEERQTHRIVAGK